MKSKAHFAHIIDPTKLAPLVVAFDSFAIIMTTLCYAMNAITILQTWYSNFTGLLKMKTVCSVFNITEFLWYTCLGDNPQLDVYNEILLYFSILLS